VIDVCDVFSKMSHVRSIICTRASLVFVNHEVCLRLSEPEHRLTRRSLPHLRYLSMLSALLHNDMLLSHLGQTISLFKSLHLVEIVCLWWSENRNPKNTALGNPSFPTIDLLNDSFGTECDFCSSFWYGMTVVEK
jgi:hypothetical protein